QNQPRDREGLQMTVHSPKTGEITFQKLFPLGNFFGYFMDLEWHVGRLQEGSIVVFAVSGSGMIGLRDAAATLSRQGSLLANHIPAAAHWIWVFIKGGRTIVESAMLGSQLPVETEAPVILRPHTTKSFGSSLDKERWQFCQTQGALGSYCDEQHPAPARPTALPLPNTDELNSIPVLITGGTRIAYLYFTLSALFNAPGLRKHNLRVFICDTNESVLKLLNLMDIQYVRTKVHGTGNSKLFQYYRAAYQYVAENYPNAPAAIFMDEDVQVSPDFFSLMAQMIPLLRVDPSIYCVTATAAGSSLAFPGEKDKVKRVASQVLWGYALTLDFIREALSRWPTSQSYNVIYDLWMYDNVVGNRECVTPEVPRTRHYGAGNNTFGFHLERFFLRTTLLNESGVRITNLNDILLENWTENTLSALKKATILEGNPCTKGFFHNRPNGTYVFFYHLEVNENNEYTLDNYFAIGECHDFWAQSDQGWHDIVTALRPRPGLQLYLVGSPVSPYVHYIGRPHTPWAMKKLSQAEQLETQTNMRAFYDD
ncbi:Glycosyl transferase family 13, partial [Trinorchestia longiramus]